MYKNELLNWWFNLDPLTEEEEILLKKHRSIEKVYDSFIYEKGTNEIFNRLLYSNINSDTYMLDVAPCATDFIKMLFDRYVDDDTLVIYSKDEHENVKACVNKCKNKLEISYKYSIEKIHINKIIEEAKKYKKVFVYLIGTNISNGRITSQLFFDSLKHSFVINHIDHIFVLDDVHGMFIVPRDYRLFDYVIGTAHALVKRYDMGILIHKKTIEGFGEHISNWLYDYFELLDIILKRRQKLQLFQNVMQEYFSTQLAWQNYTLVTPTAPHIFAICNLNVTFPESMFNILKKKYVRLEGKDGQGGYIRLRFAQCITDQKLVLEGLDILEKLFAVI